MRKGVILIGVAPEAEVEYPRLNPQMRSNKELVSGHTHFFTVGREKGKAGDLKWGQETGLKYDLAKRITVGRKGGFGQS